WIVSPLLLRAPRVASRGKTAVLPFGPWSSQRMTGWDISTTLDMTMFCNIPLNPLSKGEVFIVSFPQMHNIKKYIGSSVFEIPAYAGMTVFTFKRIGWYQLFIQHYFKS
ncbi:MAG: hypothetical protein R3F25_13265, partial [Gammaproteobacteria bacterium]